MFAKFQIITDHNPLRYLETANLGAVEQRLAAQLAEFNFEVCYKMADRISMLMSFLGFPGAWNPKRMTRKKS